jgi:hypothetical protein
MVNQRAVDQRREELAMLDAAIRRFASDCDRDKLPPIRPGSHGFFGYREMSRHCVDCPRKANGPVKPDQIVDLAIPVKGFNADSRLRKHISDTVRGTLVRMVRKGLVRRVHHPMRTPLVPPRCPWWRGETGHARTGDSRLSGDG